MYAVSELCDLLRRLCLACFFFFFQAEDGIRDLTVTGVQTCALPIFRLYERRIRRDQRQWDEPATGCAVGRTGRNDGREQHTVDRDEDMGLLRAEIGRASCRERV